MLKPRPDFTSAALLALCLVASAASVGCAPDGTAAAEGASDDDDDDDGGEEDGGGSGTDDGADDGAGDDGADDGTGDDGGVDDGGVDDGGVDDFILGLPHLDIPPAQPKTEIECSDVCPDPEQEGGAICTYQRFTETAHFDKFVAFQPNSATLWPGTVVRGSEAENGVLAPVGVDLAPVTFSVSLENIDGSPVGSMPVPSLSAFREELNGILAADLTGATPAVLDFEVIQVNDESQLSVAIGAGISWPGGPDIAASFDFSSSEKKTKILVNFTQAYYTVDVDTHNQPSDFFVDGTTVDDLSPYMSASSPPLYVQSITYGRRVIFSVQTSRSASEVKAALEASYQVAGAGGEVSISTEHQQILEESTIRAFVLGGNGDDATGAINGFDGLISYIQNGGSYSKHSPGAAIAYKLAYLDNIVTELAFTTDYAERTCLQNRADLRVDLESIRHVAGGDTGGQLELYGQVVVRYPTEGSPVIDCDTGGDLAWVWYLPDGSYIDVGEGSTWLPPASTGVDINDVPVDAGSKLCIIADMWEDDDGYTPDDDFGIAGTLIELEDGWPGQHDVVTQGEGSNSMAVTVSIDVN